MKRLSGIGNGLFVQLIVRFTLMLMLLALLIQGTSIAMYRRITREMLSENMETSLSHVNNNLDIFNKQLVYMISQVELNYDIQQYLTGPTDDQFRYYQMHREMSTYLSTFSALLDAYKVDMILLGVNGMVYTSSLSDTVTMVQTPEELMNDPVSVQSAQNRKRVVYSPNHPNVIEEQPDSHITLLVKTLYNVYTNRTNGRLYICVDESAFYKLYQELVNDSTRFVLLDGEGNVVSDSVRENIGEYSPELLSLAAEHQDNNPGVFRFDGLDYLAMARPLGFMDGWLLEMVTYNVVETRMSAIWPTLLILALAFIALTSVLSFFTVNKLTRPIRDLSERMLRFTQGTTPERVRLTGCAEVEVAGEAFNQMLDEIDAYIEKLRIEGSARRQAELYSLQMQINPHFLYNTLTSVKYLALYGKKEQAAEACTALIALLRKTIGSTEELIPLVREIELCTHYMMLQRLRYGEGISLECVIAEELSDRMVPKLILQPLIENSIFHAFKGNAPRGTISLYAHELPSENGADLILEVIDNGAGMSEKVLESLLREDPLKEKRYSGIGLKNVDERIKIIYGDAYGLQIVSEVNVGTQITLRLPSVTGTEEERSGKEDPNAGEIYTNSDY